ncbi:GmrSD restriction endonuclease domain-containing protein [Alkalibacillus haloalkaliphilus]|uniref:GmrSD restriction endonuclease domain-containing protein n=1 Tax=Alkalibacillus haloalkaliphilus TaxID=94136 RepID=UPI0002FF4DCF|nr:DUF262 domain-containing protein [Alkalibacillus haloalkaliphilus]
MKKSVLDLYKKAAFDPSKERKDMTLQLLCDDIEKGKMVLPIYQTYIRWTQSKMVDLFNYQLLGKSPVAPVSINFIDDPEQVIEQIGFLDRKVLDKENLLGKHSVVDGQQRLSTNFKAYIDHKDVGDIVLDLRKGKFISLPNNDTIKEHQIPVGKLYNKDQTKYLEYVNNNEFLKGDNIKDLLNTIRKKHQQYYYVVNFATNLSKTEQMEWFEVLNLAGSRVTEDMVFLTDLLVKGIDFYTDYVNPFIKKLESKDLEHLMPKKSAEVSIPLATLNAAYFKVTGGKKKGNFSPIPSDTKAKAIGRCEVGEIKEMISITLKALNDILEFMSKKNRLGGIERVDILTYLIGLTVDKEIDYNDLSSEQSHYLTEFIDTADFVNNSNTTRREKYSKLLENYPLNE